MSHSLLVCWAGVSLEYQTSHSLRTRWGCPAGSTGSWTLSLTLCLGHLTEKFSSCSKQSARQKEMVSWSLRAQALPGHGHRGQNTLRSSTARPQRHHKASHLEPYTNVHKYITILLNVLYIFLKMTEGKKSTNMSQWFSVARLFLFFFIFPP